MSSTSIRDAAFAYRREFDWCTIPLCPPDHAGCTANHIEKCESPGKRPWPKWKQYQDELIAVDKLARMFRSNPQSNVGLILGPVSKLVRIDVDGIHGDELLKIKSGGDLPDTNEFTSGGNGRALLYRIPEGVIVATTSAKGDGEHQELRFQAKGAQTVLPPSIHPDGRVYSWTAGRSPWDIPAAFAPAWLLAELAPKNKKPKVGPPTDGSKYNERAEPTFPDANKIPVAREALAALKSSRAADCDEWIDVGMALHSVDDSLLSDWVQFSRSCPEKLKEGECSAKWSTFTRNGQVTLGTLIHMAEQDGWQAPWNRDGHAGDKSGAWSNGSVFRGGDDICNAVVTKAEKEKHVDPLPMPEIIGRANRKTGDWPRRMGSALFVDGGANNITFLEKQAALFGYFGGACGIPSKFIPDPACHTKSEVFEEFRRTATAYDAIERFPHEPIMPGHYYSCTVPKPGNGDCLRDLLGRFNPATEIDRDLILALFATLIWGGRGGTRPAFCITSDDGRGAGKTSVIRLSRWRSARNYRQ